MSGRDYPNQERGEFAADVVADRFGLKTAPNVDWYDRVDPDSGTKYEVKATSRRVGEDYPADGRFRLWENQHKRLAAAEGSKNQTAWYAFVLLDDGNVEAIQRRHPTTVTRILRDRVDGAPWNRSGHQNKQRQYKLPYTLVIE